MLNMQNVKDIEITEGKVRTIHDKDSRLIWGRLAYDTKYAGDTEQQTYSGKNIFPLGTGSYTNHGFTSVYNVDGSITVSGTAEITYANLTAARTVNYEQGKTFTLSIDKTLPCNFGVILLGTGTTREDISITAGSTSNNKTLTQTHPTATLYIFGLTVGQSYSFTVYPMIEEGSTATPFEPYVGGIPAPNPDYPQAVQVVTGEQTVTVSDGVDSEDFTISLGSIEFCKIGNYQDYIYKSGDDWYVHKECSKYTFTGSETGQIYSPTSTYTEARFYGNYGEIGPTSNKTTISTKFAYLNNNRVAVISGYNSNNWYVRIPSSFNVTTLEEMRTYVTNNTTYYPLATPTDTQIADATLVGQLNAIHEWLIRYGYNATVTGNLPIIINKTNL